MKEWVNPARQALLNPMMPISRPPFQMHHRNDPNIPRPINKDNCIGKTTAKASASGRIKNLEPLRVAAHLAQRAFHFPVEANPKRGRDAGVIADRVSKLPHRLPDAAGISQAGNFASPRQRFFKRYALYFTGINFRNPPGNLGFPRLSDGRIDATMARQHDAVNQFRNHLSRHFASFLDDLIKRDRHGIILFSLL